MWSITSDGSVVDTQQKVIAFSRERFIADICLGECCFICGAAPGTRPFNNEHIVPRWMLREYDLFSRTLSLPNGTTVRYDQYNIPCCQQCNDDLSRQFEIPISAAVKKGFNGVADYLQHHGLNLFAWMGLIFLKTHLKDAKLRADRDRRLGAGSISAKYEYQWESIQHLHSIVRSFHTGAHVRPEALGSVLLLPAKRVATPDRFDFGDLYLSQSMLLCLDDTLLIAVFNDSAAAANALLPTLERIRGPLSEAQARELMVECAMANLHLKQRPEFHMNFELRSESAWIEGVRPPKLEFTKFDLAIRGKMLHSFMARHIAVVTAAGAAPLELEEHVLSGRATFLFDDNGEFIDQAVGVRAASS